LVVDRILPVAFGPATSVTGPKTKPSGYGSDKDQDDDNGSNHATTPDMQETLHPHKKTLQ